MDSPILPLLHLLASLTLTPLGGPAVTAEVAADEPIVLAALPTAKPALPPFFQAPLQQWPRVLDEHKSTMASYKKCAQGEEICDQSIMHWQAYLRGLSYKTRMEQLIAVNDYMNARPYKQDDWVYGVSDYWAAPHEFLVNSGDCEDFAIAKYFSLRQLGFSADDMQVLLVYDIYSGTDHAVLRVSMGNQVYFLDNREDLIDRAGFEKRYRPHVAFNENDVHMYEKPLMARSIRGGDERILPGNR